jgi:hypothetical protein
MFVKCLLGVYSCVMFFSNRLVPGVWLGGDGGGGVCCQVTVADKSSDLSLTSWARGGLPSLGQDPRNCKQV